MTSRQKLLLTLGAGTLALISLLGYLIWTGYRGEIQGARTASRNYADIIEARFNATLRRADAQLQRLTSMIPLAELNSQTLAQHNRTNAELRASLIQFTELSGIALFDARGDWLYASTTPVTKPVNIADRGYFRTLRDNPRAGIVFSEALVARTTGRPGIAAARALRDEHGVFRGVVVALIELAYLENLFRSLDIGAQGAISVYRSDDYTPVVRWPAMPGGKSTPLPPGTPTREAVATGKKTGTFEYIAAVDGVRRIYSFHALEQYPFYVGVGIASADALADWRKHSLMVSIAALLLLGLLAGLLHRLSRAAAARGQLAAIVENSNDAIYSRALDGRILSWNAGAQKMLGYTAAEAIGKAANFVLPPQHSPNLINNTARLLKGEVIRNESVRQHKDGHVLDVLVSMSPLRDEMGRITGASVILEDITERKRAQAALRERDALLQTLTDHAHVGLVMVTADHHYAYVNAAYAAILGLTVDALSGKPVRDALPRAYDRDIRSRLERAFAGEQITYDLSLPPTKNGDSARCFSATYNPPVQTIHGRCVIVVVVDITARKQAEEARASLEAQLRETHKMQAVGTLAGGIAHEFNNILSAILGNVELAQLDTAGNAPAQLSLEEIRKASARARDLVEQLLTFSRRQRTTRLPIDLAPLVTESARLLRATFPARIIVESHCASDVPAVLADATQIKQVLINLATNAMQSIPSGPGHIGMRLDSLHLDATQGGHGPRLRDLIARHPGRLVRLTISDDGKGMDAATLARIFEPFFTTKPVNEGAGLGLSVVHGILQEHGGEILIDSEPGKGTTATLYLPPAATPASASAAAPGLADAQPARGKRAPRVLHIDDDPMPLSLFKRAFERRGYHVAAYTDTGEALAALRADPAGYDLVLTDYNMPNLSGLEVALQVRTIDAGLPVVVLSGFIDETLRDQAGAAGIREVLPKTTPVAEVCAALERLLSSGRVESKPL